MTIEVKQVEAIAHLARVDVESEKLADYANNLGNILDLAAQMDAVDTSNIEPMAHPLDAVARLREDVVTETDQHKHFQSIAPEVADGLYLVPKVIE